MVGVGVGTTVGSGVAVCVGAAVSLGATVVAGSAQGFHEPQPVIAASAAKLTARTAITRSFPRVAETDRRSG
jgi:hypothetical protein